MNRRDFHRFGSVVLGSLIKLAVAAPAAAFLLTPFRKSKKSETSSDLERLTNLSQLEVGVPKSFAIVRDLTDAWVKYPKEPVGSVWLVRQPDGVDPPVIAFTAECPHLGCAINRDADGGGFFCPCHSSAFDIQGNPKNHVPPRPMDRLEVELTDDEDPHVVVRFQRFHPLAEEKIPLA